MDSDVKHMQRVLELARKGSGWVAPNPMVGCVIVKDEKIIAEGYHQKYGEAHAEVNAISKLKPGFDFSNCTLYVNLEPCSHYGKTPPCSDLIVSKNFKKVVIGNVDTNPLVAGKGIEKLKAAGIEVVSGVLENESRELNKRFFTFQEKKRPYIILKWAQTADGFISKHDPKSREENIISGEESCKLVHQWRSEEQSIMVGTKTVLTDDPELTVRHVEGKHPIRIIIDRELKLTDKSKVFNEITDTIVFTSKEKDAVKNIKFVVIDFSKDSILQILAKLHEMNISSVLVEGGTILLQSFINAGIWDESRVFINPLKKFGEGVRAPRFNLLSNPFFVGKDLLLVSKNS